MALNILISCFTYVMMYWTTPIKGEEQLDRKTTGKC